VLVAGDALFTRRSLEPGGDRDPHLAMDVAGFRRTRLKLLERFRYVVPGHDALVDAWELQGAEVGA
jgi:glyoxylase-like metal-dependent hydrolase (beta-lactamase superfamily II)